MKKSQSGNKKASTTKHVGLSYDRYLIRIIKVSPIAEADCPIYEIKKLTVDIGEFERHYIKY